MINKNGSRKSILKSKNLFIIYIIIFSIILTPNIRINGIPSFRIEQVIVILFSISIFIRFILRKRVEFTNYKFPIMYSIFSFFIMLSILIGSIKGIKVIPNDFFEIYKIYIYIGIYIIFRAIIKNEDDKIKIINVIRICLAVSVIISIQQYFNILNLNDKYVPLIAPTQFKTLVNNYPYPRVIGMTSNPNEYAIMPGIGAIISWAMYSVTREKKNLIYLLIFILGALMTLSRSGFAFMVVGIITYTFLYFIKYGFRNTRFTGVKINTRAVRFIMFAILTLIILSTIIFIYLPKELTWRLIAGFDIKYDNSFQARLSNWVEHIDYFKISPFFGLGPAKSIEYEHHVDNEWLFFLRRYGIIGCFYIVLAFIIPFIKSKDKFFKLIYFSVLTASAVYMIVANVYSSFQVMPLIIILASLVLNDKKNKMKWGT